MPLFTSFALQFSNATAAGLAATGAQLLITESALGITGGTPPLSGAELASFAAAGKTVVAYVNTSVTDAARSYWNPAWVTATDPGEPDVGVVNAGAPAWLLNNLGGVDFATEPNGAPAADEAIRVDYRDPDWRALVIAQAVAQVQAGYGGVFLDDVGQYFAAGYRTGIYDPSLADAMMTLVIDVAAAVRAVNPAAAVIVNSGVFIGGDSSGGTAGALFAAYKAAINGMVIENQFTTEAAGPGVLSAALAAYPGLSVLALESAARGTDPGKLLEFAGNHPGLLPYVVPNEAYNSFVRAPVLGGADADRLNGVAGVANLISGLGGDDRLLGKELNDSLYGNAGDDRLIGGAGQDVLDGGIGNDVLKGGLGADMLIGGEDDDRLYGEAGADQAFGGAGSDRLYGQSGNDSLQGGDEGDALFGGAGNDVVLGDAGDDRLSGGRGADTIVGGIGDDLMFGGRGADVFVLNLSNGDDDVMDFVQGRDRLDLQDFDCSLAQAQAALYLIDGTLVLDLADLGGSGSVQLYGQTNLSAFAADDFIL